MSRYIDADKLMIVLNDWWYSQTKIESQNIPYDDYISVTIRSAMEAVKEQPTADVRENVKGEWIKPISHGDVLSYGKAYYECDQCHKVAFFGNEMNFCPNCGADMRRES